MAAAGCRAPAASSSIGGDIWPRTASRCSRSATASQKQDRKHSRRSPIFANGYPQDPHAKETTEVKVFAGVYGVYDVAEMWQKYNLQSPKENNIEKFIGVPLSENRQLYFDASPISYAVTANNKVAVHVSVGTEDDLVDRRANTDAFVLALKQAGFFVRTTILQGAPHYWGSDPIDEPGSFSGFLAPRLLRFLAEKL
jgi:acetyl esterase/lipase